MISLIVALAAKNAIGKDNDLLCYLPADLKHFKTVTSGHAIIMGRKTFESLPNGALPNRKNIVISRNEELSFEKTVMTRSLEEAIREAIGETKEEANVPATADSAHPNEALSEALNETLSEAFIIGGASIYKAALPLVDRMYLTFIDHEFPEADTFFPDWNAAQWREISREAHSADEKNRYDYTFVTLERIKE